MTQLEPLRQSLLTAASARAAAAVADAQAEAATTVAAAQAAARKIIETARAEGERAAESRTDTELVAAERAARALVLDAQRAVEDEARTRAFDAAMALRQRPEYQRLLDSLEASARRRLGASAVIERDPDAAGGIRARLQRLSLDYTLTALVERALTRAFAEAEAPSDLSTVSGEVAT